MLYDYGKEIAPVAGLIKLDHLFSYLMRKNRFLYNILNKFLESFQVKKD